MACWVVVKEVLCEICTEVLMTFPSESPGITLLGSPPGLLLQCTLLPYKLEEFPSKGLDLGR